MAGRQKILVIRFSSLGDVVLSTVLFPNLKAHWPESEVTLLTRKEYAPLFEDHSFIDHVMVFHPTEEPFYDLAKQIREERFDVMIDLQGNLRSWFLRVVAGPSIAITVNKETWARHQLVWFKRRSPVLEKSVKDRILDCLKPLDVPVVFSETQLTPKNVTRVLETFNIDSQKTLIGLAPGAKHNTKRWSPLKFAEAANRLGAFPNSLLLMLGDLRDRQVADEISGLIRVPCKNLVGWTSLPELVSVVSRLSFLLTNDSGLMHVAEALKIPLVALFGPTVRWFGFSPYRSTSRVVEVNQLACRPCTLHGDETCPLKHHQCMEEINVDAVLYAASSVFSPEPSTSQKAAPPNA